MELNTRQNLSWENLVKTHMNLDRLGAEAFERLTKCVDWVAKFQKDFAQIEKYT